MPQHDLLAREPAAAAALLGLDVEDGRERRLGLRRAEREVGVAVQAEDFRVVDERQRLDVLAVDVDVGARRHVVAAEELEVGREDFSPATPCRTC